MPFTVTSTRAPWAADQAGPISAAEVTKASEIKARRRSAANMTMIRAEPFLHSIALRH